MRKKIEDILQDIDKNHIIVNDRCTNCLVPDCDTRTLLNLLLQHRAVLGQLYTITSHKYDGGHVAVDVWRPILNEANNLLNNPL